MSICKCPECGDEHDPDEIYYEVLEEDKDDANLREYYASLERSAKQ